MKDLELTQSADSPQSSTGFRGLSMVDDPALAIGMFLGDSGFCWPELLRLFGDTVAGNLRGISGDEWSAICNQNGSAPRCMFRANPSPDIGVPFRL
jgi:hypothetical protein